MGAMSEPVSSLGVYRGFSALIYDGWQRSSRYVMVRDGTRLAVDVLRPTLRGELAQEPLPAIWTHTRYQRASLSQDGRVQSLAEGWNPWLAPVIRHGYVALVVDVRGGGASFGVNEGQFSERETRDAYDITEWIAAEPWCDGNVGMYGRSYLGITQYFAAGEAPPHLKAIFPEMASFDHYDYVYPGGIFRESSRFNWQVLVGNLDQSVPMLWMDEYQGPVAPVDEDADGSMLSAALREHRANRNWYEMLSRAAYRDSVDATSGEALHSTRSPNRVRDAIEASGVAIYHLAGWFDMFPRDTLQWWCNLRNPQKVVIGPWFHVDTEGLDLAAEHLRWYDYWLKGIDNGVMDEDPIHYFTLDASSGEQWRSTAQWPLPDQVLTAWYFGEDAPGSIHRVNHGSLTLDPPRRSNSRDEYTVDYTTTSGTTNRWANANGGPGAYPDMAPNDAKSLTYTTAALCEAIEITGHPVVHLWVDASTRDVDLFVYLADVDPEGVSHYVTEGAMRASHRALGTPGWNNLDLPYHPSRAGDVTPLPDEPVELIFDLHPTSKRFWTGHRIRISVAGADIDNSRTPVQDPPPVVNVYRDADRASRVVLPVIPSR